MPETTDKRPKKKYTSGFKADAGQLATAPNVTIAQTARDLGIGDTLLRVWIKAAGKPPEGLTDSERTEVAQLHCENRRLRDEREMSKKAAAFFGRDQR